MKTSSDRNNPRMQDACCFPQRQSVRPVRDVAKSPTAIQPVPYHLSTANGFNFGFEPLTVDIAARLCRNVQAYVVRVAGRSRPCAAHCRRNAHAGWQPNTVCRMRMDRQQAPAFGQQPFTRSVADFMLSTDSIDEPPSYGSRHYRLPIASFRNRYSSTVRSRR